MGKRKQHRALCGFCKKGFASMGSAEMHARDAHQGNFVKLYEVSKSIDLREDLEPSIATRTIEAHLAVAMGEKTDDHWLIEGELE